MSCAKAMQLICAFIFTDEKSRFSHEPALSNGHYSGMQHILFFEVNIFCFCQINFVCIGITLC